MSSAVYEIMDAFGGNGKNAPSVKTKCPRIQKYKVELSLCTFHEVIEEIDSSIVALVDEIPNNWYVF
jgi:hypothetical protein